MKNIGLLIRQFRENSKLSRAKLAENICSEKYLYLIEKGARNPSAEIIRLLSIRLGVDLFKYMEYLDCLEPVKVQDIVSQLAAYRSSSNFEAAKALSQRAEAMVDFQSEPWIHHLQIVDGAYMVYIEGRCHDCIRYLQSILDGLGSPYSGEDYVASFCILLASCHLYLDDGDNALTAINQAERIATRGVGFKSIDTIISLGLVKIIYYTQARDLDQAIETGTELEDILLRINYHGQANLIHYFIANAYFMKGNTDEAHRWFVRCLGDLILYQNCTAANIIAGFGHFHEIFQSLAVCDQMKEKFVSLYGDVYQKR